MNLPKTEQLVGLVLCWLLVTAPVACQTQALPSGQPADPNAAPPPTQAVASVGTRTAGEDWPSFLGPRGDGTSLEKGVNPALWQPHPKYCGNYR